MAYSLVGFEHIVRDELPPGISSFVELEHLVRDQRKAFLYSTIAMLTLVLYDYVITLNMEVKYIWRSKDLISVTSLLFVLNRYYPIIRAVCYVVFSLHPPQSEVLCVNWMDYNSWSTMVNIATVETLMLSRTWALYGRSRLVGFLLLAFWCITCAVVVGTVKSELSAIPHVIPLAPKAILPCDRPSPYKYMVVYCAALLLELISFLFMMGRIMYLIIKSKAPNRNRAAQSRSLALPLIRGLQWHGLSYFLAVIFVMTLTVYSSFNARLARAVVNAGVAPTITSIACNRVIFALRGLYFDITERGGDGHRSPAAGSLHPPPLFPIIQTKLCPKKAREVREAAALEAQARKRPKSEDESQKEVNTNYEYYDDEIAITRNDVETRDLTVGAQYHQMHHRSRDEERGRVADRAYVGGEVQRAFLDRRVVFPGARTGAFGTPSHTHGVSSSTVMTSDESLVNGPLSVGEDNGSFNVNKSPVGHATHGTSKSSFKFLAGPSSASSHAAPGGSGSTKRSLSSLSGAIRSPTREGSSGAIEGTLEDTPMSTSPRCHGISERLGSIWRIKKDGNHVTTRNSYQDGVGEDTAGERSRNREREREKEKHPLDHHYEMETIHSELIHQDWTTVGDIEETETTDDRQSRPGRIQTDVIRTGVGGLSSFLEGDTPHVSTHSFRMLEKGLFYHEPR